VKLYKPDNLAVGDLVRHILYPVEEWAAVVLEIDGEPDPLTRKSRVLLCWAAVVLEIDGEPDPLTRKSRVLLCMLPGVKNEYFFKYRFRKDKRYKNDKIGWLSINWLRKYSS